MDGAGEKGRRTRTGINVAYRDILEREEETGEGGGTEGKNDSYLEPALDCF